MAQEYNKILYNFARKPSSEYKLIAIPMYMYRVETDEFTHGLNFFQKTILKLKARPNTKDERIAELLGFDSKLVAIIIRELTQKKLLNQHGTLSPAGKEMLMDLDGLIVDSTKKRVGYIFKYVNEDRFYDYYIHKITTADVLSDQRKYPGIITGTKGEGQDYVDTPLYYDIALSNKITVAMPAEKDIIKLINNSNKKYDSLNIEGEDKLLPSSALNIKLLNEQPEIVWVSTYVYMQKLTNDCYDPEWRVSDPFGFGDNIVMKFYLINQRDPGIKNSLNSKFSNAKLAGGKIYTEYYERQRKQVEEKLLSNFVYSIHQADANLQQYVESLIKQYIILEDSSFKDIDASLSFSLYLQNILENILKQDYAKRISYYQSVYKNLDDEFSKKKASLISIFRTRVISSSTFVPQPLINQCKGKLSSGKSLLAYLVSFILTYNYDNNSILFEILNNQIETFISIAYLRNEKGHGQTESENRLKPLAQSDVEKYYNFVKKLINTFVEGK